MKLLLQYAALMFLSGVALGAAVPRQSELSFNREIRPILSENCYACHGPDKNKGGLRLDSFEHATGPTRSGLSAIVPGKPDESELIFRVSASHDDEDRMPKKGEPLSPRQIESLRRWIAEGARFEPHWAFQPPARSTLPEVNRAEWARNPIDRFVLVRLQKEGLAPSPRAEWPALVRRMFLDLIGLPPTPADVEEFARSAAGDASAAVSQLTDRLLASPQFGVHWARHWLDLARYADSNGYQHDDLRSVWLYRDWVVRALNDGMPYDQFTVEQLAGDLLPNATADQRIATGFSRNAPVDCEGGTPLEESEANVVFDRVNTVGAVWLAATLECARCHTHKFDPIPQRDYYRLAAFFRNTADELVVESPSGRKRVRGPMVEIPLDAAADDRYRALVAQYEAADAELKTKAREVLKGLPEWEKGAMEDETVPEDVKRALRIPAAQRNRGQKQRVEDAFLDQHPETKSARLALRLLARERDNAAPPTSLVLAERAEPRQTHVLAGGNYLAPTEPVEPGVLGALNPLPPDAPRNRLGLARWLVDPTNPLTARVAVNRWWAEIFGCGIVATTEDFGLQGDLPSHPELLDWLAVELVENRWSMKHVLKLIVTSETYRQSSRVAPGLLERDPENRLLARGARFRLAAEAIRDQLLTVGGLLDLRLGGPPVYPWQPDGIWKQILGVDDSNYIPSIGPDLWRRTIYGVWRRTSPHPSLMNFDAPTRGVCTVRRARSNTPLQALDLMNDPLYLEAAFGLARRLLRDHAGADRDRLHQAYRLALARPPRGPELATLTKLLAARRARYAADAAGAGALLGTRTLPEGTDAVEFAAWFSVAHVLLNLDETITKE